MDDKMIPIGPYCYSIMNNKRVPCIYWRHRSQVDKKECGSQDYGYCLFLEKGDIEFNQEPMYKEEGKENILSADEIGLPLSLLWDRCKMCGVNDEWDDD